VRRIRLRARGAHLHRSRHLAAAARDHLAAARRRSPLPGLEPAAQLDGLADRSRRGIRVLRGHRAHRREGAAEGNDGVGRRLAPGRPRRLAGLAGAPAGGPALGGPGLRGRGGAALPGTRTRREDPGRAPGARVCRWRRAPGRKGRNSWGARRVLVLSPPSARTAASRSGRGGLGAAAACGALRAVPRARRARGAAGGRWSVPLVLRRDGEVVRMSQRRFGLRLRMLATLTGAGLLCGAVLTVVLLLGARDEITRRHVGSARAGIRAVGESAARHCGRDAACFSGAVAVAGLTWQEGASCGTPLRIAERLVACEEVRGGALRQEVDLAPAAAQARSLIGPVLVSVLLGMLLLVVLVSWVLDRQLVAPLGRVDEALDRVSDRASFGPLLAEGGDFLGRLAPAVNRLDLRL